MLKFLGLAMLFATAVAIGSIMAHDVKMRVEELVYVKKLMTMFKGELSYKNAMLSEAFMVVGLRAKKPYDRLFKGLSEATEENNTMTMAKVFETKVDELLRDDTFLKKEDIHWFKELGETMGYQDQKMQLANIDLYIERLSQMVLEEKEKMNETMKMYRTLGVMAGLLLFIAFI